MSEAILPGAINSSAGADFTWKQLATVSNSSTKPIVSMPTIGSYFMIFMECKVNKAYTGTSGKTYSALILNDSSSDSNLQADIALGQWSTTVPVGTLRSPIFCQVSAYSTATRTVCRQYAAVSYGVSGNSCALIREGYYLFAIGQKLNIYDFSGVSNASARQVTVVIYGLSDPI